MNGSMFKRLFWVLGIVVTVCCFAFISIDSGFSETGTASSIYITLDELSKTVFKSGIYSVKVSGHMAYSAAGTGGIYEINKKDPVNVSIKRQYGVIVTPVEEERIIGLDIGNGYIYAVLAVVDPNMGALLDTRLEIISLLTFRRVGSYQFGGAYGGLNGNIQVSGDYVYVLSGKGLQVFDVSNPRNPVHIDGLMPCSSYGGYESLKIIGNIAYVSNWGTGVFAIDITNPDRLLLMGSLDLEQYLPGIMVVAKDFDIKGTLMFCTNGEPGMTVIDISDPYNMRFVKKISLTNIFTGGSSRERSLAICINNNHAFLTSRAGKGKILDISNINNINILALRGNYNGSGNLNAYFGKPCVEGLVYLPSMGDTGYSQYNNLVIFDRESL